MLLFPFYFFCCSLRITFTSTLEDVGRGSLWLGMNGHVRFLLLRFGLVKEIHSQIYW